MLKEAQPSLGLLSTYYYVQKMEVKQIDYNCSGVKEASPFQNNNALWENNIKNLLFLAFLLLSKLQRNTQKYS